MEFYRIKSVSEPDFETAWEIYRQSFPLYEQRTPEHQAEALQSSACHFTVVRNGELFVGFIIWWDFDDYIYIEHYAIDPTLRGGGYGSRVLRKLIEKIGRPVILEIDPPEDEISVRRLNFYERLGFVLNPYLHPVPKYQQDGNHCEVNLRILTYPSPIGRETYERFNNDLHRIVLKRG